ncbi:hypothetical protein B0H14DRAFT_3498973 [Mycena olivaceomarginata]|nr:hypothetical protein B0H14DRAFT_3498973 [Mycena olivaceomarginata]
MSSHAALYQTKLTGYFRWWPINVDSGSRSDPIDVEWWTYFCPLDWRQPDRREAQDESEHIVEAVRAGSIGPESDSVAAVPGLEQSPLVDNKVFDCGICWDTLYKPVSAIALDRKSY